MLPVLLALFAVYDCWTASKKLYSPFLSPLIVWYTRPLQRHTPPYSAHFAGTGWGFGSHQHWTSLFPPVISLMSEGLTPIPLGEHWVLSLPSEYFSQVFHYLIFLKELRSSPLPTKSIWVSGARARPMWTVPWHLHDALFEEPFLASPHLNNLSQFGISSDLFSLNPKFNQWSLALEFAAGPLLPNACWRSGYSSRYL